MSANERKDAMEWIIVAAELEDELGAFPPAGALGGALARERAKSVDAAPEAPQARAVFSVAQRARNRVRQSFQALDTRDEAA